MMKISATLAIALAAVSSSTLEAFVTPNTAAARGSIQKQQIRCSSVRFMSEGESTESAFVADDAEPDNDKSFDAVEKMGRGAAKVRGGDNNNFLYAVRSSILQRTNQEVGL